MFTREQVNELLANKNVAKCSSKSITYKKEFKIWAVKKYINEGYSPNMIFEEAGFDIDMIGRNNPKECLRRWRRKYSRTGEAGLTEDNRGKYGGRRKELRFKNDTEKIKYLEAKIAYMDAENDFLAKLRGLKRE
jgi:transposase-like protein